MTLRKLSKTTKTFISLITKLSQRCPLVGEMSVLGGKTAENSPGIFRKLKTPGTALNDSLQISWQGTKA